MTELKWLIIAIEALAFLVLGAANIISDRFLGAAILLALGILAASCAWALWPTSPGLPTNRAAESLRRAGSSRRPPR